jgi:hypothetical protein
MNNDAIDFIKSYCDFSNPNWVWMLKGVTRSKDNQNNPDYHKCMRRFVLTKVEDIEECYRDWVHFANDYSTVYRTYISLNSRDTFKAAFSFQHTMATLTYDLARGLEDALVKSKNLSSLWKTELEQLGNRGTKRFLLDVDNCPDEPTDLLNYIRNDFGIYCHRKTVSGWAIVIDAGDTRDLIEKCKQENIEATVHKDSMLFVEQF